jgi:hypothetical protein
MSEIFLSASVPVPGRGNYHESANPFLIQCAVRELVISTIREHRIVWGGHPTITPMIWTICEDLGLEYADRVVLYQSTFFDDRFPEENEHFRNVIYTDSVEDNLQESLQIMRAQMIGREGIRAAVFIGGMDGVEVEYEMFAALKPEGTVLPVPSPGGAAFLLAERLGLCVDPAVCRDVNFAGLFARKLSHLT